MNPSSNLFLIGSMGAGKTTVGRKLADRFGLRFIDLDHEIEAQAGASVNLIFELEGEPAFRARESKLLEAISSGRNLLLATGGGAILDAENRAVLRSRGFVVYLQTDVDTQLERLRRDRTRPLLKSADPRAKLESLALIRNPLYAQTADLTWLSQADSPKAAATGLVISLRARWQQLTLPEIDAEIAVGPATIIAPELSREACNQASYANEA
jgi:shikimate kinase